MTSLPEIWHQAYQREIANPFLGADPLPERRAGRLLFAFILTGLVFVALPGTLLGVWNLLSISSEHGAARISAAWIQAHGQAQLFGWVGSFIIGISLYVLPKFMGRTIGSIRLAWAVWVLWAAGSSWRWIVGVTGWHWRIGLVSSAILQLSGFLLSQCLLWLDRDEANKGKPGKAFPGDLASWLGIAGFSAFAVALVLQVIIAIRLAASADQPVFPPLADRVFLILALWTFAIPVAWSYSTRFVTIFVGLRPPVQAAARWLAAGAAALVVAALMHHFLIFDVLALALTLTAVWALQVFRPSIRAPKRIGVYQHYPAFIRLAYLWCVIGAALGVMADLAPNLSGLGGASRHALTVGFLAMLIFCVGPLILPSFLASRQLRSPALMGASLWLLAIGCLLRVASESVAYSASGGLSWQLLPVSGVIELTAVCLFVLNFVWTMVQPVPAWFAPHQVNAGMTVYFCVTSFPKTKHILIDSGLQTLARVDDVPRSLTLEEAAAADKANINRILSALREFFAKRQPRRHSPKVA